MLFMSGHLPFKHDGKTLITGRIGEDGRDVEYGYQAARQIGLNLVATLKEELGDLDRVEKIVKVRDEIAGQAKYEYTIFFQSLTVSDF